MTRQTFYVYDLDGTTVDSAHRTKYLPCGSIDMDHWIANCIPEKISQDTLFPLANQLRRHYMEGKNVIICTAREMTDADYDFLDRHQLKALAVLSREPGNKQDPGILKLQLVNAYLELFHSTNIKKSRIVIFDDNDSVIRHFREVGALCHHVKN